VIDEEIERQLKHNEQHSKIFEYFMDMVNGKMNLIQTPVNRSGIPLPVCMSFARKFDLSKGEFLEFFRENSIGEYKNHYVLLSEVAVKKISLLVNNFALIHTKFLKDELEDVDEDKLEEISEMIEGISTDKCSDCPVKIFCSNSGCKTKDKENEKNKEKKRNKIDKSKVKIEID
jgi:radical SAM protein with 4Fe4S-binding SPASM domain